MGILETYGYETFVGENQTQQLTIFRGTSFAYTLARIRPGPFKEPKLIVGRRRYNPLGRHSNFSKNVLSSKSLEDVTGIDCHTPLLNQLNGFGELKEIITFETVSAESFTIYNFKAQFDPDWLDGIVSKPLMSQSLGWSLSMRNLSFIRFTWFVLLNSGVSRASIRCGKLVKTGWSFANKTAPNGRLVYGILYPFILTPLIGYFQRDSGNSICETFVSQPSSKAADTLRSRPISRPSKPLMECSDRHRCCAHRAVRHLHGHSSHTA